MLILPAWQDEHGSLKLASWVLFVKQVVRLIFLTYAGIVGCFLRVPIRSKTPNAKKGSPSAPMETAWRFWDQKFFIWALAGF
jgi:hypothetical protein